MLIVFLVACHAEKAPGKRKGETERRQAAIHSSVEEIEGALPTTSAATRQRIARYHALLFGSEDAIVMGNQSGPITLVEFYDYQCIHCRNMAVSVHELVMANPQLRIVLRPLPIRGHYSVLAAKSVIAAEELDPSRVVALHQQLLHTPLPLSVNTLSKVASDAGYDAGKLYHLAHTQRVTESIKTNHQLALEMIQPALGMVATPVTIIGSSDKRNHYAMSFFIAGEYPKQVLQNAINQVEKGLCTPSTCD